MDNAVREEQDRILGIIDKEIDRLNREVLSINPNAITSSVLNGAIILLFNLRRQIRP